MAYPIREGYTFQYWDSSEQTTIPSSYTVPNEFPKINVSSSGSTTAYAFWTINTHTITFDTNGGTNAVQKETDGNAATPLQPKQGTNQKFVDTLAYNTVIYTPGTNGNNRNYQIEYTATRDNYDFAGWYPDLPPNMPDENLSVTAMWEPRPYKISFDTDGGTLDPNDIGDGKYTLAEGSTSVYKMEVPYQTSIRIPKDPSKNGMIFMGWMLGESSTTGGPLTYSDATASIPKLMPGNELSYKACWKPDFTVTAKAASATSVRVTNPNPLVEYRIEEIEVNGEDILSRTERASWTSVSTDGSMVFNNLTPNRNYVIWGRYREETEGNSTYNASFEQRESNRVKTP